MGGKRFSKALYKRNWGIVKPILLVLLQSIMRYESF